MVLDEEVGVEERESPVDAENEFPVVETEGLGESGIVIKFCASPLKEKLKKRSATTENRVDIFDGYVLF